MSTIGNRYDRGPHADFRAAEGDYGHSGSFNDVNLACTKWLEDREVSPGQTYYGTSMARRNARKETAK